MIRILEGRVGSGKSTRIIQEVAAAAQSGERALLIVPEQLTLATELKLVTAMETAGLLMAEVLSPSRLMQRVSEAAGGLAGRVVIDERGRAMALRAALCELDKTLLVFSGCGGRQGFIEWLAALLGECSQGDIGPTELRLAADSMEEGVARAKLYDLAAIFDRYLLLLEGRFLDTAQAMELFVENVYRADFLQGARAWVDGFDIMPPRTLRMVAALGSAMEQVTIALTLAAPDEMRGETLFAPVEQSLRRLTEMCAQAGIPILREHLPREEYHSADIGALEREWDAYPLLAQKEPPSGISLTAAPTPREECELAAAAMLALNRDQGMAFGDMACALGDEEGYAPLMRRALDERGIPHFIARPITADTHPAARYWLSAMEAATTGMRPGGMARVLRSGWSGAGEDQADLLSNLMVQRGMLGRAWQRPLLEDQALEEAREAVVGPLVSYARRVKGQRDARGLAHAAYLLLEEAGVYPRLVGAMEDCQVRGDLIAAEQHAQAWNRMLDTLDQAVELMGEHQLTHAEFLMALRTGLEGAQLAALPPRPGQVMVTSIPRVKGPGIRALFVVGLNDGVVPSIPAHQGLLGDDERERVNAASRRAGLKMRLNGPAEQDQAEAFSLYAAMTLPTHKLHLSYAQAGEDGANLRPSPLVDRLRLIFPALEARSATEGPGEGGAPALWRAARALLSGAEDEEARATWRYFAAQRDYADALEDARAALAPPISSEDVDPTVAQSLFGGRALAITRLERFALCPCQHFIQNGLRPQELFEPGIRPVDAGTLFHQAIERILLAAMGERIPWSEVQGGALEALLAREADPLLDAILETPGYQGGRIRARIGEIRRTLDKTARMLAYQLEGSLFVPMGGELPFGQGQPVPPLTLALEGGGEVNLEGRIDRVDVYRDRDRLYLRVIDYKSGDSHLDTQAMAQGLSLQLPLYASVAQGLLGGETAGMFYAKIADAVVDEPDEGGEALRVMARRHKLDGLLLADEDIARAMDADLEAGERLPARLKKDGTFDARSRVLDREAMEGVLSEARRTAASLARRILRGEAAPRPALVGGISACQRCQYRGICALETR